MTDWLKIITVLVALFVVAYNSETRADDGTSEEVLLASAVSMTGQAEARPETSPTRSWFTWTGIVFFRLDQTHPTAVLIEWRGGLEVSAIDPESVAMGYPLQGQCVGGRCEFVIPPGMNQLYTGFTTMGPEVVLHMNTSGFDCKVEVPAVQTLLEQDLGGLIYRPYMREAQVAGRDAAQCDMRRVASR